MKMRVENFGLAWWCLCAAAILAVQPASAQLRAGASYLEVIPGAEQQGIATTLSGTLDHFFAFYTNPGATGLMREWQLSASYTKWIPDIYHATVVYGRGLRLPWNKRSRLAFGLSYLGIKEFDSSEGRTPFVSGGDLLASASLGQPIRFISDHLSLGGSVKYYHSRLDNFSANSLIFDVGLLFRTGRFRLRESGGFFEEGIFSAGISLTQFGKPLQFKSEETPLPRTLRAGVGLHLGTHDGFQTHLSAEYRRLRDEDGYFGVGAEFSYAYFATVRAGYSFEQDNVLRHFAVGASFRFDDIRSLFFNPGRSNAVRVNTVKSQQNDFFSSPYSGTINYYPIGPEYFDFASPPHGAVVEADTVRLQWQDSRDPDLFDDTSYWLAVDPDSLKLAETVEALGQHPRDMLFAQLQQPDFFHSDSASETTFTLRNLHAAILALKLENLPEKIDYYWTVVAFDKDRHHRIIRKPGEHISKFSMLLPDLRIEITRSWQDSSATGMRADVGNAEIVVRNSGSSTARDFGIAVYDHPHAHLPLQKSAPPVADSLTAKTLVGHIRELQARSDTTFVVQFALQDTEPAQHFLTAYVDDEAAVMESRENNNAAPSLLHLKYDLSVQKTANIDTLFENEPIRYRLQVTNHGPVAAKAFMLTDILPGEIVASGFRYQPVVRGDTLTWQRGVFQIEALQPNQSIEIDYEISLKPPVAQEPIILEGINFVVNTAVFIDSLQAAAVLEKALPPIREALLHDPNAYIEVAGHTDPSGGDKINIPLSQKRAERVKRYFVERDPLFGLLVAKGYASQKPRFPNDTPAMRRKNRRVEISLPPREMIRPSSLINASHVTAVDDINPENNFAADTVFVYTPPKPAVTYQELHFEFEFDDDRLALQDIRKLDYAAGKLARLMQEDSTAVIEISGHTDSIGDSLYNEALSVRRARTVYHYLQAKWRGAQHLYSRLQIRGYGKREPVATNKTEEGRKRNRRIEFRFDGKRLPIQRPVSPFDLPADTAFRQEK